MKDRKKEKQQKARQKANHDAAKRGVEEMWQNSTAAKAALKKAGCDLRFYDFLDRFQPEFERIAKESLASFPSLRGIHELDMEAYRSPDLNVIAPGIGRVASLVVQDDFPEYGKADPRGANLSGVTYFCLADDGTLQTLILLPRNPPNTHPHPDMKYIFKLSTLFHELGHVHDVERRINIDPFTGRFDMIEAEVYASLYALDRLAERSFAHSYGLTYDAMVAMSKTAGYIGEVGRRVLEVHDRRTLPSWQTVWDRTPGLGFQ